MRHFFTMSRRRQWLTAVPLASLALLPLLLAGAAFGWLVTRPDPGPLPMLLGMLGIYIAWLLLFPLWMPLIQFASAPLLHLLGHYRYYSPMLLVEKPTAEEYRIHGGTNFDYFVHLRWRDRGPPAARKTLRFYLQGLLAIADDVEDGRLPGELRIVASSHIFTPTTARRLGFELEPVGTTARLGLYLNYGNLLWKHSFARGRLAFPDLGRIRQAATTGERLARHRGSIEGLLRRLERTPPSAEGARPGEPN
jgi:hypothetical protein